MVMLRPTNPAIDPASRPRREALAAAPRTRIQAFFRLTIRTASHHRDDAPHHGGSRPTPPPSSGGASSGGVGGAADAQADRWAYLKVEPPSSPDRPAAAPGNPNRLNLLLSWGGWQNESWADRLPALLEPMGVHSLRVRTAREAERAIRSNPVHIAVVDLGLPLDAAHSTPAGAATHQGEEAGPRVLELLRRLDSPPPTVVVQQSRSARDASRHMSAALRCDAFAVVDRAAADVELMLKVLQRCLQRFYHGRWPGSQ